MKRCLWVTFFAAVVLAVGQVAFGQLDDGVYRINGLHSLHCLEVTDSDDVHINKCGPGGGNDQGWLVTKNEQGSFEMRSIHHDNDKCLDVQQASTNDGQNVYVWPCHDGNNQRWTLAPRDGGFELSPVHSSNDANKMCLDTQGHMFRANALQSKCSSGDKFQVFEFKKISGPWKFGRKDAAFLCDLELTTEKGSHGFVIQGCNPNESFWAFDDHQLTLIDQNGTATTRLTPVDGNVERWEGAFLGNPEWNIVHYIHR